MNRKRRTISLPENKIFKITDYLLIFFLLQIRWISLLLNIRKLELILVPIVFYVLYRRNRTGIVNQKILMIFFIYLLLALVQGFIWGFSVVSLITSFSYGFLLPYFLFRIYREDFLYLLERVIKVLTIIALTIWMINQILPGTKETITYLINALNKYRVDDLTRGMIFYTYWPQLDQSFGLSRNAGFASEPGQFAVLIILALVINYVRKIQLFDRKNIIYYIALLSTFSTAGYLALAALGLLLLKQRSSRIVGVVLFPLFVYGALFAFNHLDFMKGKIEQQYEDQIETSLNEPTTGRILGARKSLVVLSKYPLYGRGVLAMTKPDSISDPEYANYGWISEMSRFGIIFGCLYMFFFFKGLYYFVSSSGNGSYEFFVCALAIMINLSSQVYITSSFFMMFFFIGMYGSIKANNKYTDSNHQLVSL